MTQTPSAPATSHKIITVAVVEDHRATRDSLKELINRASGFQCIGVYASGEAALQGLSNSSPDVVLMDINLPGMSGIECVARLKQTDLKTQVIILTTYEDSDLIFESLRAGATGYLLKNMPPRELIEAVAEVHAGGSPMSMHIARKIVSYFQRSNRTSSEIQALTKRDQEILALLAKGFLYKEIADQLGISLSTVRTHLHATYEKLHVQTRTEAVLKYLKHD